MTRRSHAGFVHLHLPHEEAFLQQMQSEYLGFRALALTDINAAEARATALIARMDDARLRWVRTMLDEAFGKGEGRMPSPKREAEESQLSYTHSGQTVLGAGTGVESRRLEKKSSLNLDPESRVSPPIITSLLRLESIQKLEELIGKARTVHGEMERKIQASQPWFVDAGFVIAETRACRYIPSNKPGGGGGGGAHDAPRPSLAPSLHQRVVSSQQQQQAPNSPSPAPAVAVASTAHALPLPGQPEHGSFLTPRTVAAQATVASSPGGAHPHPDAGLGSVKRPHHRTQDSLTVPQRPPISISTPPSPNPGPAGAHPLPPPPLQSPLQSPAPPSLALLSHHAHSSSMSMTQSQLTGSLAMMSSQGSVGSDAGIGTGASGTGAASINSNGAGSGGPGGPPSGAGDPTAQLPVSPSNANVIAVAAPGELHVAYVPTN